MAVAANRDELLSRAASPPRLLPGPPRILAPRDEVAGGTWLGLNEHGLFVGITNRAGIVPEPRRSSRGLLVLEALSARGAVALHEQMARVAPDRYNPFHLLYADDAAAFVTWSDGTELRQVPIPPGVHVVTERSLGGDDRGRMDRLLRLFDEEIAGRPSEIERLARLIKVHGPEGDPLAGSCVHAEAMGYGTRSGFAYHSGSAPRGVWFEGKPCVVAPIDFSDALGLR